MDIKLNKDNYKSNIAQKLDSIAQINKIEIFENESEYFDTVSNRLKDFKKSANVLVDESKLLKIGIVGQVKAGKSSFLNGLFFDGQDVLPKAATPMTAGLVIIQYAEKNSYEVEFYSQEDWKTIEDEHRYYNEKIQQIQDDFPERSLEEIKEKIKEDFSVLHTSNELFKNAKSIAKSKIGTSSEHKEFKDYKELQNTFEKYVGAEGEFTSVVKSITISINDEKIKHIQIVDTPGINDPIKSRERRTDEMLRLCHGVFLLSYGGSFFSQEDYSFVQDRIGIQGISKVVVLASKYDSLLLDEGRKFQGDVFGAINHLSVGLQKDWEERKSLYDGISDFEMNVTSGMAFAISQKSRKLELNEEQEHIYGRLERFFPEAFSDFSKGRELLSRLSNYDVIRNQYVEEFFVNNRDSIVSGKLANFFDNQSEVINKELRTFKSFIENKKRLLNSSADDFNTALSNIENAKEKFTDALEEPFKDFLETFYIQLEKEIDFFKEEVSKKIRANKYKDVRNVKLNVLEKKRSFWLNKTSTKNFTYVTYSANKIQAEISELVDAFSIKFDKQISDKNNSDKLKKAIQERFVNLLSQSINKEIEVYFKNTLNENIDNLLKKMSEAKTYSSSISNPLTDFKRVTLPKEIIESENRIIIINRGEINMMEYEIDNIIKVMNEKQPNLITSYIDAKKSSIKVALDNFIIGEKSRIKASISALKKDFNEKLNETFSKDVDRINMSKRNHESTLEQMKKVENILKNI